MYLLCERGLVILNENVPIVVIKETIAEEEYYQMALLKTILGNSNAKGYLKMICVITVVYLVMWPNSLIKKMQLFNDEWEIREI